MRKRVLRLAVVVAVLGVVPLVGADPASASVAVTGASGGLELQYVMEGTLPVFPCLNCSATFGGGAKGAGWMQADAFNQLWDVKIEALNMSGNSGRVVYQESGTPYCPTLGQAAGTITMTDPYAVGTVYRSGMPNEVGDLDAVTVSIAFTYQRVGAAVVIAVTSASIRADFHAPTLAGSVTAATTGLAGAATGVFVVTDPVMVANRCHEPGPLPFLLAGTASVEIVHAPRTGGEYKDEGDLYGIGTGGQDEGGRFLCASAGGWTDDCFAAATTTGASTGNVVGVTGTGASVDNIAAVTGTGSSSANYLGVTGTGTSTGNDVSVSGTNRADGDCNSLCWEGGGNTASISGTGPAAAGSCASMVAVSATGDACGRSVAVSGTGTADGGMQVSGKEELCVRAGLMC
ncbi:MAG TPA: hypothetical protein VM938_06955 [Acidimicrobiales bacterium]|nr:hypothetical protein [Acidimicrobiales bacterium]